MTLHLLKLCVGVSAISDLSEWIEEQQIYARRAGRAFEQRHTTRMVPKREAELLRATEGPGSLFWVIKGQIACRQQLLDIRPFTDGEGIGRCHLVLKPEVIPVEPRPYRAFQGWRYLTAADAPRDLSARAEGLEAMPEEMRRELAGLGLI
ncbi:MAG: DUF1489 domain-containing protein [Proteobacteria bacterium]|nr:DUF1489 domain-containing protein [Pseudomonadota bacterium]